MGDELLTTLMPAMDLAAFSRQSDGTFRPLAPHPAWFDRLIADKTFPFLGHILEEALSFWEGGAPGRRDWGPCEEVDEAARPFHYKVIALNASGGHYLLFQLDPESDRTRQLLQKVRADALAATYQGSAETETLLAVQREVRRATSEIQEQLQRFVSADSRETAAGLAEAVSAKCGRLAQGVDILVSSARPASHH